MAAPSRNPRGGPHEEKKRNGNPSIRDIYLDAKVMKRQRERRVAHFTRRINEAEGNADPQSVQRLRDRREEAQLELQDAVQRLERARDAYREFKHEDRKLRAHAEKAEDLAEWAEHMGRQRYYVEPEPHIQYYRNQARIARGQRTARQVLAGQLGMPPELLERVMEYEQPDWGNFWNADPTRNDRYVWGHPYADRYPGPYPPEGGEGGGGSAGGGGGSAGGDGGPVGPA